MPKSILFLCTGNYYRSRFAEVLFNHLAAEAGLEVVATSRALAIERGACNVGPMSSHTVRELGRLGIALPEPMRNPLGCGETDLAGAWRVVAVKETEHRPLLAERFPGWADRVTYWHVHDLDLSTSDDALGQIAAHVRELIAELREEAAARAGSDPR